MDKEASSWTVDESCLSNNAATCREGHRLRIHPFESHRMLASAHVVASSGCYENALLRYHLPVDCEVEEMLHVVI